MPTNRDAGPCAGFVRDQALKLGVQRIRRDPATSTRFFAYQLPGEEAPTFAAMNHLCQLAAKFSSLQPWTFLDDDQLVLAKVPESDELCHCCVLGALGEVFGMHAYLGTEGYRFFRRLQSGEPVQPGEFFANQRGVYVDFVKSGELEKPDRELLRASGYKTQRPALLPIFRANRPGYYPWYVTENEAAILAASLEAVLAVWELVRAGKARRFWTQEGTYPLVVANDRIEQLTLEEPPPTEWKSAKYDEDRLARLQTKDFRIAGAMELDHFYARAAVGKSHERKACLQVALAVDAGTGFAYPPEVFPPSTLVADALANVILRAIETQGKIPKTIRVREPHFQSALAPLAERLGIDMRVVRSLPALDDAKFHLLTMMEGG